MIEDAPDTRGIYVLWRNGVAMAVGCAYGGDDTIRSRLQTHLAHAASGLSGITHYTWEICQDPVLRRRQVARALGLDDPDEGGREPLSSF